MSKHIPGAGSLVRLSATETEARIRVRACTVALANIAEEFPVQNAGRKPYSIRAFGAVVGVGLIMTGLFAESAEQPSRSKTAESKPSSGVENDH